MKLVTLLDIIS